MNKEYKEAVENIDYGNLVKELRGENLTAEQQADCEKAREVYDATHGLK